VKGGQVLEEEFSIRGTVSFIEINSNCEAKDKNRVVMGRKQ